MFYILIVLGIIGFGGLVQHTPKGAHGSNYDNTIVIAPDDQ